MKDLEKILQAGFEGKTDIKSAALKKAVEKTIEWLDEGKIRVASKKEDQWVTHQWVKQAILLYFKIQKSNLIKSGAFHFFDKVPLKKWTGKEGVRVVPQALVRKGAYVKSGAILMPSYINIGAYVGAGTLVDTWATVGSCAQIGSDVHLSGGVGIGGVLEPIQAAPVIIEDHVFVGSRCIVVEGAVIEEGAVLGAGCVITASTKIIDVTQSKEVIYRGRVPKNSVVIPGNVSKHFPAGDYGVPCTLIIGQRNSKTDTKTSLNDALREISEVEI